MLTFHFRLTGAIVLSSAYGYDVSSVNDPMLEVLKIGMKSFGQAATPTSKFPNPPIREMFTQILFRSPR